LKVKPGNIQQIVEQLGAENWYVRLVKEPFRTFARDAVQQYDSTVLKTNRKQVSNQKYFTVFSPVLRKARKRIETLFSQLCDQFMIRRNYAKSFHGFATRILSKITALNVIQWLNKQAGRNINNLKFPNFSEE
jgi:hypothetical protein